MNKNPSQKTISASRQRTLILCECSIMIALSAVLSLFSYSPWPQGGSITPVSMLPVMLIALKYGTKVGLGTTLVYSIVQLGLDLPKLMGYGMNIGTWIGCLIFDYLIAFTILGLAGLWRKKGTRGIIAGMAFAIFLRYVSHVISGWIFFGQWAWEGWENLPFLYSLCYNGTYMLPEMIFTVVAAVILFRLPTMHKLLKE